MKKFKLFFVFMASLLVLSFVLLSCDALTGPSAPDNGSNNPGSGSRSTFTITGIPSEYNGKYVELYAGEDDNVIRGYQRSNWTPANPGTFTITLSRISNGSVSIPLWKYDYSEFRPYTGNDILWLEIYIYHSQLLEVVNSIAVQKDYVHINYSSIRFSNGNATVSWSEQLNF